MICRGMLCRTIAGNRCEVLTITESSGEREAMGEETSAQIGPPVPLALRMGIVFTARVHPGESNSSWIMDGLLRFITGDTVEAAKLRANFVFKIVPMLNPDGVINGNYRCGLAGHDLNRRYLETSPSFHPTIFFFKRMMKRFKRERPVGLFVDVHGHSSKPNAFVYGCEAKRWREWFAGHVQGPPPPYTELVFPTLLEERSSIFSMADSSFKLRKSKLASGRAVMWHDGIASTFTLEASFGGASHGPCAGRHFGIQDLRNLGRDMCLVVWDMYGPDGEANSQRVRASGPAHDEERRSLRAALGSLSARSDLTSGAGAEGWSESEGSGQESSEDETINDPASLFPILEMSERLKFSSDNLSKGLQSSGNGKPWKKLAAINPNRPGALAGHKQRTAIRLRVQNGPFGATNEPPFGAVKADVPQEELPAQRGGGVRVAAAKLDACPAAKLEAIYDLSLEAAKYERAASQLASEPRIQQKLLGGDAMSMALRAMRSATSTPVFSTGGARKSQRDSFNSSRAESTPHQTTLPSPSSAAAVARRSDGFFPVPMYVLARAQLDVPPHLVLCAGGKRSCQAAFANRQTVYVQC